jgi:hypothetical protein
MDTHDINVLPNGIIQIEELLTQHPSCHFNFANIKKPFTPLELTEMSNIGYLIKGLNIELDCCDSIEIEELYPFTEIEFLRLNFTNCQLFIEDLSSFQYWLMELTNLKVIILKYGQKDNDFFEAVINSLSRGRTSPLTVIFELQKRKGPKKIEPTFNFTSISSDKCNLFTAPKMDINQGRLEKFLEQNVPITNISTKDFQFSGYLEVENGEWQLDVNSLVLVQYEEVIFSFEGKDDDGKFKCSGRSIWNNAEGGFYFASKLPVRYLDFNDDEEYASIKFNKVEIDDFGDCIVRGVWIQNREEWIIEGKLAKA